MRTPWGLVVAAWVALALVVGWRAPARAEAQDAPSAPAPLPMPRSAAEADGGGAPRALRICLEVLAGATGEAVLGLAGFGVGGSLLTGGQGESWSWTGAIVGGSMGGSLGAALGVASVGDLLNGRGSWGWTFGGAALGGLGGALTWTLLDTNHATLAVELLAWTALPLLGALLGYELSIPDSQQAGDGEARRRADAGLALRAVSVRPVSDLSGGVLEVRGTL